MTYTENIVPAGYEGFFETVSAAWDADTSAYANWGAEGVPDESGQCAVTALAVQDEFGGFLKRALVNGESHYWNEIDDVTVDFTRAQFKLPLTIEDESERLREYVLSFPISVARYEILTSRING